MLFQPKSVPDARRQISEDLAVVTVLGAAGADEKEARIGRIKACEDYIRMKGAQNELPSPPKGDVEEKSVLL